MSQMATTPVYACRACGKPVAVTVLRTTVDDPQATLLKSFMAHLHEIAYCKECRKKQIYLQSQGRGNEFLVNPKGVIYAVVDDTKIDYYGRKLK